MVSYISRHIEESYNKLLHADTYCYARFCVSRCAPFYTKTLSAICAGEQGVMWQLRMNRFFSILLMAVLCGCTSTKPKEEELKFSYQDNYDYFGYVTHWVGNPEIPPTDNNIVGAEKDFSLCKSKINEHLIDAQAPSRDIQYAFIVECMYKSGWFLSAETYIVTQ